MPYFGLREEYKPLMTVISSFGKSTQKYILNYVTVVNTWNVAIYTKKACPRLKNSVLFVYSY